MKDSTVRLAVKAGIEFSFRINMLTCKRAGVNEFHFTKDVDKHIKSQTQTNSFNHKSIDLNDLKAYKETFNLLYTILTKRMVHKTCLLIGIWKK